MPEAKQRVIEFKKDGWIIRQKQYFRSDFYGWENMGCVSSRIKREDKKGSQWVVAIGHEGNGFYDWTIKVHRQKECPTSFLNPIRIPHGLKPAYDL